MAKKANGPTLKDGRASLEGYVRAQVARALGVFAERVAPSVRPVGPVDSAIVTLAHSIWIDPTQVLMDAIVSEVVKRASSGRKGRVADASGDYRAVQSYGLARMVYAGLCAPPKKVLEAIVKERLRQVQRREWIGYRFYGVSFANRLFFDKRTANPHAAKILDREKAELVALIRSEWEGPAAPHASLRRAIDEARVGRRQSMRGEPAQERALKIMRDLGEIPSGRTWNTMKSAFQDGARRMDATLSAIDKELGPLWIRAGAALYPEPDGTTP